MGFRHPDGSECLSNPGESGSFGFRYPKHFAHRCIETPLARQAHRLTANPSPSSRPGVLEDDLPRTCVGHRLQVTERTQRRRTAAHVDRILSRTFHSRSSCQPAFRSGPDCPNLHRHRASRSDSQIRDTIPVKHVRRDNTRRLPGAGINDETRLPAFDRAGEYASTVPEQQFVRAKGNSKVPNERKSWVT